MTTTYIIIGIVLMIGIQFVFPTALSSIMTGLTYGFGKAMFEAWAIRRKRIREERAKNPRKPLFRRNVVPATEPVDTPEAPKERVRRRIREDNPEVPATTVVEEPGEVKIAVTADTETLQPVTPTVPLDERRGRVRAWVQNRRGRHG